MDDSITDLGGQIHGIESDQRIKGGTLYEINHYYVAMARRTERLFSGPTLVHGTEVKALKTHCK